MTRIRLGISGLLGSVGLIAVDLWVYKQIYETFCGKNCVVELDPMLSLCVLGLLPASYAISVASALLIHRVRRGGEGNPFLLGFCASGLFAALSFVFVWWLAYDSLLTSRSLATFPR